MFYTNNFERDSTGLRQNRLLRIETNSAEHSIELGLNPETILWASTCCAAYLQSRQMMHLAENERQEATSMLREKWNILEKEYQVAALFARQLYADMPDYLKMFGFDKPMPRTQGDKKERVAKVVGRHHRMVDEGIAIVLPVALVSRLQISLDEVSALLTLRDEKKVDARQAARDYAALWANDTRMLRRVYSHCVLVWGNNHPSLNAMGFAMRQQGGGS